MDFISPIVFATLFWIWIQLLMDEAILIPLPKKTIREMLKIAKVKRGEVVYDLGSGDGRVVEIAAKEFHAKSVGVERNYFLYMLSRHRGKIIHGNIFHADISKVDVIVIYLSHKITQRLKDKFKKELKRGSRIVSASHPIEGWKCAGKIRTGHFYSYLYIR